MFGYHTLYPVAIHNTLPLYTIKSETENADISQRRDGAVTPAGFPVHIVLRRNLLNSPVKQVLRRLSCMPQIIRDIAQPVSLHQVSDNLPLRLAEPACVNQALQINVSAQRVFVLWKHAVRSCQAVLKQARPVGFVILGSSQNQITHYPRFAERSVCKSIVPQYTSHPQEAVVDFGLLFFFAASSSAIRIFRPFT